MKHIAKLSLVVISTSLASCYSPASADPIGDTFTHAGNVIGRAVNSVAPKAPAHTPAPAQYGAPYSAPTNPYPTR